MKRFILSLQFYFLLFLLVGCTVNPRVEQPTTMYGHSSHARINSDMHWHSVCFYMAFTENGDVSWVTDLMLADLVIAPLLEIKQEQLPLWRFHRRAVSDSTGHKFSFIYFTDPASDKAIGELITQSAKMRELLDQHHVERINLNCGPHSETATNLAATSDSSWDPRLQRSWPYFIMGVSAHWLALIQEIKASLPQTHTERKLYDSIEKELIVLWQHQGQHAYFHHLSAVFGYQPLVIQRWIQF